MKKIKVLVICLMAMTLLLPSTSFAKGNGHKEVIHTRSNVNQKDFRDVGDDQGLNNVSVTGYVYQGQRDISVADCVYSQGPPIMLQCEDNCYALIGNIKGIVQQYVGKQVTVNGELIPKTSNERKLPTVIPKNMIIVKSFEPVESVEKAE